MLVGKNYFSAPKPKLTKLDLDAENFVFLRGMSASQLLELQKQHTSGDLENVTFLTSLISTCVCDDCGNPLFTSADDVRANFNLPFTELLSIGMKCCEVSGIPVEKKD